MRSTNLLSSSQINPESSGLGLLEFLLLCQDLGMEPIMAVWAGLSPSLQCHKLSLNRPSKGMPLEEPVSRALHLSPTSRRRLIRYLYPSQFMTPISHSIHLLRSTSSSAIPQQARRVGVLSSWYIGRVMYFSPAALRASLGHPKPFDLTYIEIGNEDFVGSAPSTFVFFSIASI